MAGLSGGSGGGSGAIRAGRAFVELSLNDSALVRGLSRAEARLKSFGSSLTRVGAGAAAAGALGLAPIAAAITDIQDLAKQGDIAEVMGLTAEAFTGIVGVAKAAGSNTKEFIESLSTLNKLVSDGMAGKGEVAADFFTKLGVGASEFAGLKADEQFYKIMESIRAVSDPAERLRLLMVAFGEDGGKLLIPLLKKTPEELRAMGAAFAVSGEDIKQAQEAQQAYASATNTVGKTWRQVVVAVAPAVKDVAEAVAKFAEPIGKMIADNRDLVRTVFAVAAGLAVGGAAVVAFGLAFKAAAALIGGVAMAVKLVLAAVTLLLNPIALVAAAVGGLAALWLTSTNAGREAASELGKAFQSIGETFNTTFEGIGAALKSGNLKLAFEIAGEGIKAAWFEMLAAMGKAFAKFVEDNREKIIALGGILGAIKGGRMGGVLGPLGLIGGVIGGGVLGGLGADKLADALKGLGDTKGLDAAAAAAKARLALLVGGIKAVVPGGGPDPATDRAIKKELDPARLFDAVKGSFFTPSAYQQFGYGDSVKARGLNAAEKTAVATAKTAVEMAKLVLGLKMA